MSKPTAGAEWKFQYLLTWVKRGYYLKIVPFTIEDACRIATNENEFLKNQSV